jgi:dihydrofolate reductase
MKKTGVFIHLSVDGFFAGPHGEIDWFKSIKKDEAYDKYTHEHANPDGVLVFGRATYQMMKSFWPTENAAKSDPEMAKAVNNSAKIVFSKTLKSVEEGPNWKNITLRHDIDRKEILELKKAKDITILGSGSIVQQFANLGLIDDYHFVMVPVVLGEGKSLFKSVSKRELNLLEAKSFKNGLVTLRYRP